MVVTFLQDHNFYQNLRGKDNRKKECYSCFPLALGIINLLNKKNQIDLGRGEMNVIRINWKKFSVDNRATICHKLLSEGTNAQTHFSVVWKKCRQIAHCLGGNTNIYGFFSQYMHSRMSHKSNTSSQFLPGGKKVCINLMTNSILLI